jgi:glycogen debranching enzyme
MCAREFYLDGAKRDRWLWGGDAYEAEKAEYYYQYDTERIKRSIVALFGKTPVVRYINHIMDYTMYTIISVWEYYEHTGDKEFLEYIEPIMTEHLEFSMKRLSEDGFICSIPHKGKFVDWIFVDWGKLPDKNGEVSFEQILFWTAIRAVAKVYGVLGKANEGLYEFAEKLQKRTDKIFWDEEKGVYVFARNNGVLDETVTCHANVFSVLYGFANKDKKARIVQAIRDNKIELSITPFTVIRLSTKKKLEAPPPV